MADMSKRGPDCVNPVAGTGAGADGTVTVLFVQDRLSGQVQVKLSAARASWLLNDALKGKLLTNGADFNAFIYANTDDTLFLASNGSPPFGFDELHITEPSCALQCSDTQLFEHDGALCRRIQSRERRFNIAIKARQLGISNHD